MSIVVIGATGRVGSKVVAKLAEHGHDVVAVSPASGVDTVTGEGLAGALAGAEAVVDVSNSPSFEDAAALEFFETSTRHLLETEYDAGVRHHVALSIVGAERIPTSGYLRAKVAQERLIVESGAPYSIIRATQLFEFAEPIAESATRDGVVRLPSALVAPVAADDLAAVVARTAVGEPLFDVLEVGGPEAFGLDEFVRRGLAAAGDGRAVVTDPQAPYFGAVLEGRELVPGAGALLCETHLDAWLRRRVTAR